MRILQICNKAPYPPKDGGAIAMLTFAESFAELGHQVTILAMNTFKHSTNIESIPNYYKEAIKFIFTDVDINIKLPRLIRNYLFSKLPYNAERFIQKSFSDQIVKLLTEQEFEIIQLEGLYLLPYIPVIRKYSQARISYRAHNIENEIWFRFAKETTNPVKKIYLNSLSARIKKFESQWLNQYDLLVPITKRDAEILMQMGNTKPSYVCPAGITEQNFKKSNTYQACTIFFIGALDWMPNQESVCWFVENVWNDLKAKLPALQFHIAGRNTPAWLHKKYARPDIFFHGEIENAHDFFDSYQIMVVPLFAGSGMRLKIVEAMARSKVIITTSIGAEGLDIANGVNILIEDTPQGFVKQVIFLLENPETFAKIEKEAYLFASDKYSSKKLTTGLIDFYQQQLAC